MSYIPNTDEDRAEMLAAIGAASLDDLFAPIRSRCGFKGRSTSRRAWTR